jgi:hypothetical protein
MAFLWLSLKSNQQLIEFNGILSLLIIGWGGAILMNLKILREIPE